MAAILDILKTVEWGEYYAEVRKSYTLFELVVILVMGLLFLWFFWVFSLVMLYIIYHDFVVPAYIFIKKMIYRILRKSLYEKSEEGAEKPAAKKIDDEKKFEEEAALKKITQPIKVEGLEFDLQKSIKSIVKMDRKQEVTKINDGGTEMKVFKFF